MLVLLYAALVIFAGGNIFRLARMAFMPVHLRWELFPIPAGPSGKLKFMAGEILLLKAVWEHNRPLWVWSWLLHWALYLMICVTAFTVMNAVAASFGLPQLPPRGLISLLGWCSAVCGMSGAAGLIVCRAVSPLLRVLTSRAGFMNLGIILALFATALVMLAAHDSAPETMITMAGALLGLESVPSLSRIETIHLCVVTLFLSYFPFSHMTHMYLKYFTFHSVRWDDVPLDRAPALQRKLNRALDLPARWSAPHISGSAGRSWRAIAAEEVGDARQTNRN